MNTKASWLIGIVAFSAASLFAFQNCSSGGGGGGGGGGSSGGSPAPTSNSTVPAGVGTFVDDPVAGLTYTTSSGLSGTTNSLGEFQFNPGDVVTFSAMGVKLGSASPTVAANGASIVTPISLVPGATDVTNPQVTSIAQFLNTLNAISTGSGGGANGTFVMPTNSNLQSQLGSLNSPASSISQTQLQSILDSVFGGGTYTVTAASTAQTTLQHGINSSAIIGSVWQGTCTCGGGATLFFQGNGVLSGVTNDGNTISGTWTADSSGNILFGGTASNNDGYGQNGSITAGSTTGAMTIYKGDGTLQGTLNLSEVVGGNTANSGWGGFWVVTYTANAYGVSLNDTSGCANLIVGPGGFWGVTNDGNNFSGSLSSSGAGSASFNDGHGTTVLNFNMDTLSGTASSNGQVKGTLSLSQSGACAVTGHNGSGSGSGSGSGGSGNGGNANLLLNLNITWNNSQTGKSSMTVSLQVLDSTNTPIANTIKNENSGGNSSSPLTTTDQIGLSYSTANAASFLLSVSGCTVTNGTGSLTSGPPANQTVHITCN